jgi:hypothetical protein
MSVWSSEWQPVLQVIDNARLTIARELGDQTGFEPNVNAVAPSFDSAAMKQVWLAWRDIFGTWATVKVELGAMHAKVAQVVADDRFVPDEQRRLMGETMAAGRPAIDAAMTTITTKVTAVRSELERMALPPRPQPADATQEARLANTRSDVEMVLVGASDAEANDRLVELLEHYLATGDELGVWFIGASDWPILRLRGSEPQRLLFSSRVGEVLAKAPTAALDPKARRMLGVVTGPRGLEGAVMSMQHLVRVGLDAVANYRSPARRY